MWANSGPGDVVVANAEDPVVLEAAAAAGGRGATVVTFGLGRRRLPGRGPGGGGAPGGAGGAHAGDRRRAAPFAAARSGQRLCAPPPPPWPPGPGPTGAGGRSAAFRGLPHRVELVGEARGVRFYDDSKATTPGAVLAALDGFPSAVLIAGGRNKGLDLSVLRSAAGHLRGVVAIGEAAAEVGAAFAGACPVVEAALDGRGRGPGGRHGPAR